MITITGSTLIIALALASVCLTIGFIAGTVLVGLIFWLGAD